MMFKSKNFGDDEDRVVKNHKGNWTYFANDVAYHYDKVKRNYNHLIIELGTDHIGYSKRLKSAVHALSEGKCNISTIFHDLVNLEENGNILKMSKRDGNFITIDDLLEKIDQDVIRFIIMTRKSEALINFDITKAQDKSKDNPVFYVQYAHARIYSVFRNSNVSLDELNSVNIEILSLLNSKYEIDIIRKLAYWPRIVESSCIKLEAHFITFYLQELSSLFHNLWSLGNDDKSLRFISDNKKLTIARLYLLQSIAIVIGAGLKLLGVKPIEEM